MKLAFRPQSSSDRRRALAVAACLFLIYNLNLRQVSSADTMGSRFVPISILRDGDLALDDIADSLLLDPAFVQEAGPDFLIRKDGHLYDTYPIIGPLLALPVYAVPIVLGVPIGDRTLANVGAKLAGSGMAALSAALLLLALARAGLSSRGAALCAVLLYGLGTSVWSTASQSLWTHSAAILGYSLALWALVAGQSIVAGVGLGIAVLARPATAPAAAILGLWRLHVAWRRGEGWGPLLRLGGAVAVMGLAGAGYNLWLFGTVMGGTPLHTARWRELLGVSGMFEGSLPAGLLGLLISPSRGILIFSPVVVLAGVGAVRAVRALRSGAPNREVWLLGCYAAFGVLAVLLVYSKFVTWWGGHGFGPRYLTDAMPLAAVLFGLSLGSPVGATAAAAAEAPAVALRSPPRRGLRVAVIALAAYSTLVQAIGATCWPSSWTLDKSPPYHERLWSWRYNQILTCVQEGPHLDPAARRLLRALGLPAGQQESSRVPAASRSR